MENEILESTLEEILELIELKKFGAVKQIIINMNGVDIAALFDEFPAEVQLRIFRLLPKELAAEAFVEFDSDLQEKLIKGFSDKELREVISEMYADDAADIVEEMPANVVKRILKQADPEMRMDINQLLKYPEDSAGSVMTTEFFDLKQTLSVEEALQDIRKTGIEKETVNTCYVTTSDRVLLGTVSLRTLIISSPNKELSGLMEINPISVTTDVDRETVAKTFNKYGLLSLPVVDTENRLVGIVTVDDVLEVIEEEVTEDIVKMAAITPNDKTYFKTGVFETFKVRFPWLLLLMISGTFTGLIISGFESRLTLFPALIAFIPMLMGTAGNSGGQSSATIIRAISLEEVDYADVFKVIWKEIRVAFFCGLILAVVNFAKIWLIDIIIFGSTATLMDNFIVSATILLTVMVAKCVGSFLPMFAHKIGLDPAVIASPIITTAVDIIVLIIYFGLATLFLGI